MKGCLSTLGIVFVVFMLIGMCSDSKSSSSSSNAAAPADPKQIVRDSLRLSFEWRKEGFGNVMVADFLIGNHSARDVKDVEITCTHSAASGTLIDENTRTIYEVVRAGKKRRVNDFNMGLVHSQAKRSACRITDFAIL